MLRFLVLTFLVPLVASPAQQPAGTAVSSAVSACGASDDPDYAYSPKAPVQVGGGAKPLLAAAGQTVETTWKADPTQINGAPVSSAVTLLVKFAPGQ